MKIPKLQENLVCKVCGCKKKQLHNYISWQTINNFNGKLNCLITEKKRQDDEGDEKKQKCDSMSVCCVLDTNKSYYKTIDVDGLELYRHHLGIFSSISTFIATLFGTGLWLANPAWHIWWTMTLITLLWRSLKYIYPSNGLAQKAPDRISYLSCLAYGIIMTHIIIN